MGSRRGGLLSMTDLTEIRRAQQHLDRWTNLADNPGILEMSERLSVEELRRFEIFTDYDDGFLERISPDVTVATWESGSVLFEEGSYIDLAFWISKGSVEVFVSALGEAGQPIFDEPRTGLWARPDLDPVSFGAQSSVSATRLRPPTGAANLSSSNITLLSVMDFDLPRSESRGLGRGELFGEIGALSGWPQSITARVSETCEVVQIRLPALRLMKRKSKALKERVDALYRERSLTDQLRRTPLFQHCSHDFLEGLKETVELVSCEPDEVIVREGEPVDSFYMVRSGFVKLSQNVGEGDVAVSYLSKGMSLGEVEFLMDDQDTWYTTASSVAHSEIVKLQRDDFDHLISKYPAAAELLWEAVVQRLKDAGRGRRSVQQSRLIQTALDQGLVEGSSILVIDLENCTRCDDCVRACAQTHGGRARFVREGEKYQNLLLPRSCYHCEDPVCLVGCPTGAIHRANVGDVVAIDDSVCIGCQACANNCPYDAIVMHETGETWPDDMLPVGLRGRDRKLASKCDLCFDTGHGPACVSNCPQGCAFRVESLDEFRRLLPPEST